MLRKNKQKKISQKDNIQFAHSIEGASFHNALVEISQTFFTCHHVYRHQVFPHLRKYNEINNEDDARFSKLINAFVDIHKRCFEAINNEKFKTFRIEERNLYLYYGAKSCYLLAEYYTFGPVIILDKALLYAKQYEIYEAHVVQQLECSVWMELTSTILPYLKELLAEISALLIRHKINVAQNSIVLKKILHKLESENDLTATIKLAQVYWDENKRLEGYCFFWKAFFGYFEKSRVPVEFTKTFNALRAQIEAALLGSESINKKVRRSHLLRLHIVSQADDKEMVKNEVYFLIQLLAKKILSNSSTEKLNSIGGYVGSVIDKLDKETFAQVKRSCIRRAEEFFNDEAHFSSQLPSFAKPSFEDISRYYFIIQKKQDTKAIALSYSYLAAYYFELKEKDEQLHQLNEAVGLFAARQYISKEIPILSSVDFPYFKVGEYYLKLSKQKSIDKRSKQICERTTIICFLNAFLFGEAKALRYACFSLQGNAQIKPIVDEVFKKFLVNKYQNHLQLVTAFKPLLDVLKISDAFIFNAIQYAWIFFLKQQPFHTADTQQTEVLNMALNSYKALIYYFGTENQKTESKIMDKYYRYIISRLEVELTDLQQKLSQLAQPLNIPHLSTRLAMVTSENVIKPKPTSTRLLKPEFKGIIPKPRRVKNKALINALSSADKKQNADLLDQLPNNTLCETHKESKPDSPFDGLEPADLAAYGFAPIDYEPVVLNIKHQIELEGYSGILQGGAIWRKLIGNTEKHDFDFVTDMPPEIIIKLFGEPHNAHKKEILCRYYMNGYQLDFYFLPTVKLMDLPPGVFLACDLFSDGVNIFDRTGKGLAALKEGSLATCLPEEECFKMDPYQLFRGVKLYYTFNKEKRLKEQPHWQPYFQFLDEEKENNTHRVVEHLMELLEIKSCSKMIDIWFQINLLAYLFPELSTESCTIVCLKTQLQEVQNGILAWEKESKCRLSKHERCQLIFAPFVAACCSSDLAYSFDLQDLAAHYSALKQKNKIFLAVYKNIIPEPQFFISLKKWLERRLKLQAIDFNLPPFISQLTIFKKDSTPTNLQNVSVKMQNNTYSIS